MLKFFRIMGVVLGCSFAAAGAHATVTLSGSFTADNYAFVYLSTSANSRGTLIGTGTNWQNTFYVTPTALTAGTTYYLNIEAINGDSGSYSAGGLIGDFTLGGGATFANGQSELLTTTSNWLASYNDSNGADTAQAWVTPTGAPLSLGANGISPWGTVSGVSSAAQWIWASDSLADNGGNASPGSQCASCTIDFQTSFTVPGGTAVPEPSSWALIVTGLAGVAFARRKPALRRGA